MTKPIRLYDWRNGFSPTYGIGGLGAVYDTLRKRSYRKWKRHEREAMRLYEELLDSTGDSWMLFRDELDAFDWDEARHHAYVDGVRDALQAVAERLSE